MSIKSVEEAIRHSRRVAGEWKEVGLTEWREEHTRYAIIDPVIWGLDWKIDWVRGLSRGGSDAAM